MKRIRISLLLLLGVLGVVVLGCGQRSESKEKTGQGENGVPKNEEAARNPEEKAARNPEEEAARNPEEDDNPAGVVLINVERSSWDKLKKIGLGFWNFRSAFSGFPQPGAHKETDVPEISGKLSWRVWLLPNLDNNPLYGRFDTSQNWDSEHNRKLISQMPIVYNSNPPRNDGKTSFHVFVGNGALLTDYRNRSSFDYQGKMDKIILAIEAGPDKAVEWTKPGGLEFDPNNPKAALGDVPDEFHALMMDGSVRKLTKDISNEELLELITGGFPATEDEN